MDFVWIFILCITGLGSISLIIHFIFETSKWGRVLFDNPGIMLAICLWLLLSNSTGLVPTMISIATLLILSTSVWRLVTGVSTL